MNDRLTPEREKFIRERTNFSDMGAATRSLGLDSNGEGALFFRGSSFWTRVATLEHGDTPYYDPFTGKTEHDGKYWQPDAKEAADVLRRIARNELQLVTNGERTCFADAECAEA
jgi:hypothetical protein